MTHPATILRDQLNVAARAAYLQGASSRQIDMIVALARGSDDYDVLSGGHLTGREASTIIDTMIKSGAVADWNITEGEVDDLKAQDADIKKTVAARKAAKAQKKAEKAEREARHKAAAQEKAEKSTRRVVHPKFGEGAVIAEADGVLTIVFDEQPKPLRIGTDFVTEA